MNSIRYNSWGLSPKDRGWILFYLLVLILDIFFIHEDYESLRWLSKPLLMLTLLVVLWRTAVYEHKYGFRLHLLALLLSWFGDLLLLTDLFLTGLISFLWAHICYMVLMANIGIHLKGIRFWSRCVLTALIGALVGYYIGHYHSEFQWAIIAYTIVILGMFQFSTLLKPFAPLIIAGATFFIISDFLLAYGRFIPPFDWHLLSEWKAESVMITYALAQLLLLLGFRKAGRKPPLFADQNT